MTINIFAMIQTCILQVSGQEVRMADLGEDQVLGSSQEVSRLFGSTGYLTIYSVQKKLLGEC